MKKTIKPNKISFVPDIMIATTPTGWIVNIRAYDEDMKDHVELIQVDDPYSCNTSKHDAFALRDLFYVIKESLGMYHSKHNDYNVVINVVDKNGKAEEAI